eukprot:gene18456-biopygen17407
MPGGYAWTFHPQGYKSPAGPAGPAGSAGPAGTADRAGPEDMVKLVHPTHPTHPTHGTHGVHPTHPVQSVCTVHHIYYTATVLGVHGVSVVYGMGGVCGVGGVDVVCDVCIVRQTCGLSGARKMYRICGVYRSREVRVGRPGLAVSPAPARSGRRGGSGNAGDMEMPLPAFCYNYSCRYPVCNHCCALLQKPLHALGFQADCSADVTPPPAAPPRTSSSFK